jgi:hypothetical protein
LILWCRFGFLGCKEGDQVCRCGEPGGRGCDGVAVLFQERAGFADGLGDPAAVYGEQFAKDCLCAKSAQVEHGGQDLVGAGEAGVRACSGRAAALGAAPLVPALLALGFLRSGKCSGQVVQAAAGHARQRRMRQHDAVGDTGGKPGLGGAGGRRGGDEVWFSGGHQPVA